MITETVTVQSEVMRSGVMPRDRMRCINCVMIEGIHCRLNPEPVVIEHPEEHWCGQGEWYPDKRQPGDVPYYWGDWTST